MPLAWDRFETLDGAPDRNFELLCRALVQRNYGRFGQLRSRRNQPGIEFHLKLDEDCDLGEAGRWFGWQCRWYELAKDHALGERRREGIVMAIEKAKADVEGLTDFVLCLRELPRKEDLDWFFGLDAPMALHLWADEEIEARLTGDAEILRRTYFGELILTADRLADTHARTIEPVKQRWAPDLNVVTTIERALRVSLARPDATATLREEATRLETIGEALQISRDAIDDTELRDLCTAVGADALTLSDRLRAVAGAREERRPLEARELIAANAAPITSVRDVRRLSRRLRAEQMPVALMASTVEADMRHALGLLADERELMTSPIVAVVGEAGRGKTQLAAQLTAPKDAWPAGVFLRGSDLRAGGSIDELATRLPGVHAHTFDELVEAVEAAGARTGARIPIVIDGLNDAERPPEWQTQLAQVKPILHRYPHVSLILTLRGAVRDVVLPDDALQLELEWDDAEVGEIVDRYFEHYRIEPGSSHLPLWLFAIPLFVRMFCEAVNPDAAVSVGVESLPSSLVGVFELYRDETAKRLRTRPGHPTLPTGHVERKLGRFALELWTEGVRELSFDKARELIDDPGASWDDSLVRALEEEGVLFRDDDRSAILFDRFAGYLVADAITRGLTMASLDEELSSPQLWRKLRGPVGESHPLGEDTVLALVGLLPRRFFGQQLWCLAPDDAQAWTLAQTLDVESTLIDAATVDALEALVRHTGPARWLERHAFDRLWEIRDGPHHQLNAHFLDRVLTGMSVADRDLRWSEWVRANAGDLLGDIDDLETNWLAHAVRNEVDDLNARAVAWLLTSTTIPLRDRATRALQRYARSDPARLFAITVGMLDVNDPYVTERLLAASFGAATAHQLPDPGGAFELGLREWLAELHRRYLAPNAASPMSHLLARQYVLGCFELAERLHPSAIPADVDPEHLTFVSGPEPEQIDEGDQRHEECERTFGMDFTNYIVGPLYEGRHNYQMDDPGFVAGLAEICGRVWDLGWRTATFSDIDERIGADEWRRHQSPNRTERYGKKYGLIAYYELAGRLSDRGQLRERPWTSERGVTADIDPTFPAVPGTVDIEVPTWASEGPADAETWFREGPVEVPDELLLPDTLCGEVGPWVLVEGWLEHRDPDVGRRVWGYVRAVLVSEGQAGVLATQLEARSYPDNRYFPDAPSDYATFAGEIPWSARFASAVQPEDDQPPYWARVRENWDDPGIEVECLAHSYELEAPRTVTNLARGYWVPSHNLAQRFALRERPGTLDLVDLHGQGTSVALAAPAGFDGRLLYIRRARLAEYAEGRRLVQFAWGERQVDIEWSNPPEWLEQARSEDAEVWRQVDLVDL